MFAFPLQIGSARFGALACYRATPGGLSGHDRSGALAVSEVVTTLLLSMLADAPLGALPPPMDDLLDQGAVVSQAAGMISVQLTDGQAIWRRMWWPAWCGFGHDAAARPATPTP